MPKYPLKKDRRNRITLPGPVANNLGDDIFLSPNTITALIHKAGVNLDDIVKSTKLLIEMLEHEEDLEKKGLLKNCKKA